MTDREDAPEWRDQALAAGLAGAFRIDLTTRTVSDNSGSGAAPRLASPGCQDWLDSVHPDDRPAAAEVLARALDGHGDLEHLYRTVRANGDIGWTLCRARLEADGATARRWLVGVTIDVTDLVRQQLEIQGHGDRLQLAIDAGGLAPWEWDVASGRVTWSPRLTEAMGLADTGFGGTLEGFWQTVVAADRPRVERALNAALAGRTPYVVAFRMRRPDGSVRWAETRGLVVRDRAGVPVRMVGVDKDVTAEHQARQRIAQLEQALATVMGSRAMVALDRDGRVAFACGAATDDAADGLARWPAHVRPALAEAVAAAWAGIAGNVPCEDGDIEVLPIRDATAAVMHVALLWQTA